MAEYRRGGRLFELMSHNTNGRVQARGDCLHKKIKKKRGYLFNISRQLEIENFSGEI